MLQSSFCTLYQISEKDLTELGECPCDQGGYFIINGCEKVLIAQEKMCKQSCLCVQEEAAKQVCICGRNSVCGRVPVPVTQYHVCADAIPEQCQGGRGRYLHLINSCLVRFFSSFLLKQFTAFLCFPIVVAHSVYVFSLICRNFHYFRAIQGSTFVLHFPIFELKFRLLLCFEPWALLLTKTY